MWQLRADGAAGAEQVDAGKLLLDRETEVQYSEMSDALNSTILAILKGLIEIEAHESQGQSKLSKVQV